jgi:flagellar biosynthesis protein FlhG
MMDQARSLRDIMKARSAHSMQVITITSAKGGVGKSSVALNLAIALNKRGRRTLVVDMDLGLANIDVMLGAKTQYDLQSVLEENRDIGTP